MLPRTARWPIALLRLRGVTVGGIFGHYGIDEVEFATLEWVAWYNTRRLLEPLGYVSPDEFERAYYNRQPASAELAVLM